MLGSLIALLSGGQAVTAPPPIAAPPTMRLPQAAPPPPPPPAPASAGITRSRPRLRSGTISTSDYPVVALREGAEGTTITAYEVGPDGRVGNCTIRGSAGHAALDAAACRLVTERLRYDPARGGTGTPVASRVIQRIVWRLPEPPRIQFQQGSLTWSVVATTAGIEDCRAALDGRTFAELDEALCRDDGQSELVEPRSIPAGSQPLRVTSILSVTPLTRAAPPLTDRPDAAVDSVAELEIGPNGDIRSCTVIRQRGTPPAYAFPLFRALCSRADGEPVFAPATSEGVRSARMEAVLYIDPAADGRERRP